MKKFKRWTLWILLLPVTLVFAGLVGALLEQIFGSIAFLIGIPIGMTYFLLGWYLQEKLNLEE